MNKALLDTLARTLATKPNTIRFLEKVENLIRKMTTNDAKMLAEEFSTQEMQLISAIDPDIQNSLKICHQFLSIVPTLKVTVAFRPSYNVEKNLIEILHKGIAETFIIEIVERPAIVGGAIFEYQGKVTDNSLKARL